MTGDPISISILARPCMPFSRPATRPYNRCMENDKTIAVVQMHSTDDVQGNLKQAADFIEQAKDAGARLVALPENFSFVGELDASQSSAAEHESGGPIQEFLAEQSARHGVWLVGGSLPIQADDGKTYQTCMLFDGDGRCTATYRKIHLFDAFVEETGERYGESDAFDPGDRFVVADTPCGRLGLTICYDVRFPELSRLLVDNGAEVIVNVAAFTAPTGAAHWHALLRSRAIENLCYMVAANQGNRRTGKRDCFGHSLVVDPWGKIVCELEEDKGLGVVTLDTDMSARLRRDFPCLSHRRYDVRPEPHAPRVQ